MVASMTAFSRIQTQVDEGSLIWEVRSVNHRYLDTHLKLPEEIRAVEPECRTKIGAILNRGRIDAMLRFERSNSRQQGMSIDHDVLTALSRALDEVNARVPGTLSPNCCELLRWPGVLTQPESDENALHQAAVASLETAITELSETRNREGAKLASLIQERIESCRSIVTGLRDELPDIETGIRERWQRRLEELGDEVEPARLAQELALLLTRSDVSEELDRLETHFDEVSRTLGQKKPMGRRLDFLMQELNREANTLGSKSVDMRNTNASVELKVLIDQMREQVQNIE